MKFRKWDRDILYFKVGGSDGRYNFDDCFIKDGNEIGS